MTAVTLFSYEQYCLTQIWELGFHSSSLGLELCKHFCDSGNSYRALIFLLSLLIISTTGKFMLLGQPVSCRVKLFE